MQLNNEALHLPSRTSVTDKRNCKCWQSTIQELVILPIIMYNKMPLLKVFGSLFTVIASKQESNCLCPINLQMHELL